jgi:GNAT superfamily N-acetyltransferase
MRILEYDDVDPLKAMAVPQLALDFPMSPEKVAYLRQTDPRPFPCLAIYAVEDDLVLGQVGIFRLPMVSVDGREDVGGIWAVSTHPQFAKRGVASRLLEEAHTRMRQAGLRYSTLGTNRYRVAYNLYRRHGYLETNVWAKALARWEAAHQPTRLRAEPPGPEGHDLVDKIFTDIAREYLGFSRRHLPFAPLRRVPLSDIWILRENKHIVGYALAHADQMMLAINNLVLKPAISPLEAIAAVAAELRSGYIQVNISRPVEMDSLQRAGFQVVRPTWDGFMVKPLIPEVTAQDAIQSFAIGTDRFLISWMDVT